VTRREFEICSDSSVKREKNGRGEKRDLKKPVVANVKLFRVKRRARTARFCSEGKESEKFM